MTPAESPRFSADVTVFADSLRFSAPPADRDTMKGLSLALIAAMVPVAVFAEIPRDKKWSVMVLAHPNAKMLAGVDWKKVISSPLGPVLLRQVELGGHPLFSFLESIDGIERLLISTPGEHPSGRKPLLVVADGSFALAKIRKMAAADGAITRRFNNVEMLVPPGATNDDLHFALLDGNTILFGDGSSVKGAIDRWQRPGNWAGRNPVYGRAENLGLTQDLWAAIDEPARSLASLGLAGTPLAEDVERIEAAFQVGETLATQITIRAATEESAQTLATGLPALLQLAAVQFDNQPYLTQVAKKLKVARDKRLLTMSASLEAKLLDRSFAELRTPAEVPATVQGPPLPETKPAPTPPIPVVTSTRRVIKITGAEGGYREILVK